GSWSLSIAKDLDGAVHAVRADDLKAADGSVQGRAEVSFIAKLSPEQERELSLRVAARADQADQAGRAQSMAAQGERAGDGAVPRTATEPSVGQGKTAMASGSVGDAAPGAGGRGRITVERGDNLWRIARENYGAGIRYTAIFRANKDQIRNPHLIYPGQVFLMPRLQDSK
ncbi:MAG TPA: LysM peptidoglycan-binding domain-containing protein, partial [Hyphomicrobiales bacterium]|nr:LysM peptidoglycan-binding domain-containing protein [Hyphomicrobiales bacterium]